MFSDALIIGNGVAMVLRVCEAAGDLQDSARLLCASWDTWLFLTCEQRASHKSNQSSENLINLPLKISNWSFVESRAFQHYGHNGQLTTVRIRELHEQAPTPVFLIALSVIPSIPDGGSTSYDGVRAGGVPGERMECLRPKRDAARANGRCAAQYCT